MNKKMIPEVRFEGFEDEWETTAIENISNVTMGHSPPGQYYSNENNGHVLVQGNADIKNGFVKPRIYTSKVTKLTRKNDIILTVRAPVGEVAKTNFDAVIGRGVASLTGNEFVYQSLVRMHEANYWDKISVGSTFLSINSKNISEASLNVPSKKEQQKIGEFLQVIDNNIILQEINVLKLTQFKQAMLQKMFPKEGEKEPEVRFEGFSGEWKSNNLSDLSTIIKGEQLNVEYMSEDGKYYVLNGGTSPSGYTNKYNTNMGTISISEGGNSCGYVNYNSENFWSGGHNYTLQRVSLDNKFLYQFLKSRQNDIMELRVGSGLPNIQRTSLSEFIVMFPMNKEQIAIGNFLKELDNKIELEELHLEKLKQFKKAMLQKMFV